MSEQPIPPDTKDWTWVLERPCPECGVAVAEIPLDRVAGVVRATVPLWRAVLAGPGVRVRPAPTVWSPLEYGAHVRDVHTVFLERLGLVLAQDGARFASWDQDEAAVAGRYGALDPARVAGELAAGGLALAERVERLRPQDAGRRGLRSDGSVFTVESLLQYFLHETLHHLWDVGSPLPEL